MASLELNSEFKQFDSLQFIKPKDIGLIDSRLERETDQQLLCILGGGAGLEALFWANNHPHDKIIVYETDPGSLDTANQLFSALNEYNQDKCRSLLEESLLKYLPYLSSKYFWDAPRANFADFNIQNVVNQIVDNLMAHHQQPHLSQIYWCQKPYQETKESHIHFNQILVLYPPDALIQSCNFYEFLSNSLHTHGKVTIVCIGNKSSLVTRMLMQGVRTKIIRAQATNWFISLSDVLARLDQKPIYLVEAQGPIHAHGDLTGISHVAFTTAFWLLERLKIRKQRGRDEQPITDAQALFDKVFLGKSN